MKTLHITTTETTANEILHFLETLSQKGKQIELIDDKLYQFEKKGIDEALLQEQAGEIYNAEAIHKELCL
jgi:hypothetical protein